MLGRRTRSTIAAVSVRFGNKLLICESRFVANGLPISKILKPFALWTAAIPVKAPTGRKKVILTCVESVGGQEFQSQTLRRRRQDKVFLPPAASD